MKTLAFIKDLPYSKPTISYNHYETTILDRSNFPDFVKEELQLDNDSVLTLETVKGQTPTHRDSPPRQAHIVWYISDVPMTLIVAEYNSTTSARKSFQALKSKSKIIVAKGGTHFFPMEMPELVIEEIKSFNLQSKNL